MDFICSRSCILLGAIAVVISAPFADAFAGGMLPSTTGRFQRLLRSSSHKVAQSSSTTALNMNKGKLLILGGTGYLGQTVCQKATDKGYTPVSLSRRGLPTTSSLPSVEYRQGDARQKESILNVLNDGDFVGIVHCIGLLFDDASGIGNLNQFVSGSGSLPDADSTYDTITRLTAFNAIDAAVDYAAASASGSRILPFCFTSAAEAGWPEVTGGDFIETLMPEFIHRYMVAKRAVEAKLQSTEGIRPIIVRPSLIYSMDRPASLPAVGTFTLLNKIGLPFVDRPVTVDSLATAIIRAMEDDSVSGVQRYTQIDRLGAE